MAYLSLKKDKITKGKEEDGEYVYEDVDIIDLDSEFNEETNELTVYGTLKDLGFVSVSVKLDAETVSKILNSYIGKIEKIRDILNNVK